ncbi:MAG: hypothetical protein ACT4OE_05570 [Sphingosinicella sp.]
MSRMRARSSTGQQPAWPLPGWTIQRAATSGIVSGVAAVLLGGLFDPTRGPLLLLYALLLALTALCGLSILSITLVDIRRRGTSGRMRPIRGFDMAIAAALLVPAAYTLWSRWGEFGL